MPLPPIVRASPLILGAFAVACAGAAAPPKPAANAPSQSANAAGPHEPEPAPLPVAVPEVAPTPSSCDAFVKQTAGKAKDPVCADAKSILAALATAGAADQKGDAASRDATLASLSGCEKLPTLLPELLRAELAPIACAEGILAPALDARGKEALPPHRAAARALVGASRLSRLRPKKGAFDVLARSEVDPKAAEAGLKTLVAWKDALEKEENDAIGLSKGAPAELASIVAFEIAAARIALARELRGTPFPEELRSLAKKDPDLEVRYYAKLDEVTMPLLDRARAAAMEGLGLARRDGVLVKNLPHFQQISDPFKSRPFFETKATRDLDLLIADDGKPSDEATLARTLPPWAVYAALERVSPSTLLEPTVLGALAGARGIPAGLRREAEPPTKPKDPKAKVDPKEAKIAEARMGAVALSRVRVALAYGSRSDAEAIASWPAREPVDLLRVAVAKALLGPPADDKNKPKAGTPEATAPRNGFDLAPLDALAKKGGVVGEAAMLDAAMLALDAAQLFGGDLVGDGAPAPDPKKAYEAALARLDAVLQTKAMAPSRTSKAKTLAEGARASVKLLEKAPAPKAGSSQP